MSRDKKDQAQQRDTTLARLVVAALQSQSAVPGDNICPNADLLAAYADRTLAADEMTRWESHFADCARCQEVLAVLTVSAEAPLTHLEIAKEWPIKDVSAVSIESAGPVAATKIGRPAKHATPWRWLVPAFGLAAVAVLLLALRPLAPSTIISEQKIARLPPAQETQMAQADVPPPPASNAPASASSRDEEQLDLKASSPAEAPVKKKDVLRDEIKEPANSVLEAENDRLAGLRPAAPSKEEGVQIPSASVANRAVGGAASGAVAATPPTPSKQSEEAQTVIAPQGKPAPATASGAAVSPEAVKSLPLNGGNFSAMAKLVAVPTVFSTIDRAVQWRIGAAGRIERSTDQGKTWQTQSSGVASDLLAGAAVSDKVAWIVGRASVVLRTTDGEHWQRMTSPPLLPPIAARVDAVAPSPDWSSVESSDALHATIVSADGRRFVTSDGGRTWMPQP